jgi:hypothetical protein
MLLTALLAAGAVAALGSVAAADAVAVKPDSSAVT